MAEPRRSTGQSTSPPAADRLDASPPPDPSLFINRELSWLDFNERVLEEARDPSNPLLERLRFLAICASNLDEFFEVRVAGLQAQLYDNLEPQDTPPDGMGPLAQLIEIARRAHDFVARQYETWHNEIRPAARRARHPRLRARGADADARTRSSTTISTPRSIPVLTPLAIDPAHPFPHLHNKSLNLILRIETIGQDPPRQLYAVLQVPSVLNRLVPLPDEGDGQRRFVLLEDVIGPRLDALFGGFRVAGAGRLPRHPQQRPDDPGDRGQEQPALDDPGDAPPAEVGRRGPAGDLGPGRRGLPRPAPDRLGARPRGARRLQGPGPGRPDRAGGASASSKGSAT